MRTQLAKFRLFLKDKRKKNTLKIIYEFITLCFIKREIPFYYFNYLYRKSVPNFKDYLSTKETRNVVYSKIHNNPDIVSIISNKLLFSIYSEKNNISVPKLVSYNLNNNFVYKNQVIKISNKNELHDFFNKILIDEKKEEIFIKPLSLYGGIGCFKIKKKSLKTDIDLCAQHVISNSYIHEEVIEQHHEIDKIHADCINTLRIETYIDKDGNSSVLSTFMRFGVGKSIVDNAHHGGFYIGIIMQTGKLKKIGHQYMEFGGAEITEHPTSKFILEGFEIPYYKEACNLVLKAVKFVPDRYIGWDVAISSNGPVIIEANEHPAIFMSDVSYGGYLRHPLYKDIIKEVR